MAGGQLSASAAKWLDGLLFLAILLGYGLWNVVFWMSRWATLGLEG